MKTISIKIYQFEDIKHWILKLLLKMFKPYISEHLVVHNEFCLEDIENESEQYFNLNDPYEMQQYSEYMNNIRNIFEKQYNITVKQIFKQF